MIPVKSAEIQYRKYLFLSAFVLVLLVGLSNFLIDPFHYFHAPRTYLGYSENQRFQNPGLAKNLDFETVIIGTSHTENFLNKKVSAEWGENVQNFSISASTISEQYEMLDLVLSTGKVKRVVWEINFPSFNFGDRMSLEFGSFPVFLYHEEIESYFKYLLSYDTFIESLVALSGRRESDLSELHHWDDQFEYSEKRVLAAWDYSSQRWDKKLRLLWSKNAADLNLIQKVYERKVNSLIRAYPHVTFDLLLLPTSILDYGSDLRISKFRLGRRIGLRELVANSLELSNVSVHDFQLDRDLTFDLNKYKDLEHFDSKVTGLIVTSIANKSYLSNITAIKEGSAVLESDVLEYLYTFCNQRKHECSTEMLRNLSVRQSMLLND